MKLIASKKDLVASCDELALIIFSLYSFYCMFIPHAIKKTSKCHIYLKFYQ